MKDILCASCGSKMKRNGRTKAGKQRWRCVECGSSYCHKINSDAKELDLFLKWLLSKDIQMDMPGQGRTFRRKTSRFWKIWPMPSVVDEIHRVVFVDGIYIAKNLVVLIARSEQYVLSWYLARGESSAAWIALLNQIAPPEVVVTDGGSGFSKALKATWPQTRVQRCIYHAFKQVQRCTTSRPKLLAGKELYSLAKELMHIKTLKEADFWVERFLQWCEFWSDFLKEISYINGKKEYTHERLRKARRGLVKLIREETLFTYLDPILTIEEPLPAMNNAIEGGVNAQLRAVLRNHRGLSTLKRIKAVYWWCYMHTECPLPSAEILKSMPTDDDIDFLYKKYGVTIKADDEPVEWGNGLVWEELHFSTRYPDAID